MDLEVSSLIKIETTVEWCGGGRKSASRLMCQHTWEHFAETNKTKQIPEDLHTTLHLDSFRFSFLILFWELLFEKPIMSRSNLRVIYLDSGLALRSWVSEEQSQEAVRGEEEGSAAHFYSHPWRSWIGRKNSLEVVFIGEKNRREIMILIIDMPPLGRSKLWFLSLMIGKRSGGCPMMGNSLPVWILGTPMAWWRCRVMADHSMACSLGALYSSTTPAPVSCTSKLFIHPRLQPCIVKYEDLSM